MHARREVGNQGKGVRGFPHVRHRLGSRRNDPHPSLANCELFKYPLGHCIIILKGMKEGFSALYFVFVGFLDAGFFWVKIEEIFWLYERYIRFKE